MFRAVLAESEESLLVQIEPETIVARDQSYLYAESRANTLRSAADAALDQPSVRSVRGADWRRAR